MLPIVNFKNIRTQGGTQNGGFEELIVQLLRNDLTNIKDFIRVNGAGGDGGVEAFGTLDNRSEIGVQAKYFFELGTSQWRQLSESVETALKKHPNLIEYRIAIPIDRTSTQLKKWEDKVKIWTEYAKQYGKPPIFKWWGASEIQGMLTTPSGLAKLQYWFGTPHFTQEWLNECNNGMIRSLDCRYTPRHHVKTESERILEAFCQHPSFASIYKKKSESLVLSFLEIGDFEIQDQKAQHAWNELKIAWLILREYIGNGTQSVPFQKLGIECLKNLTCVSNLQRVLRELKQKYKKKSEHDFTDPYSSSTHELSKFYQSLNEYHEFLQHYACVDHQFLLVFGEAGSGKSHLLASIIETCKRRGQAALFLLGECFTTSELPDQQLIKLTHWQGNIDGLLSVLNEKSVIDGSPSLICIDALNENHARILWKTHLLNFSHLISKYPNIRLIVSCRTDFSNATLPDSIRDRKEGQWSYIDHEGFGVDIFKAVETYFKNYSIQSDYFPPLLTEFSNPLFLKTLCEAYEGMRLESGHLTLKNVFETRIYRLCEKLLADIDCPKYITRKAIDLIADEMAKNRTARLSMMSVRKQIDDLFPNQGDSRSLYTRLRSEGLLAEVGSNQDGELYVRFQFERFFDYFSAERMLNTAKNEGELRSQWESSGFINKLGDTTYVYQNSGLIRMLAILLPEIFGIELAELWPKNLNLTYKFDAFISSIQWRGSSSFSEKSDRLILHVLNHSECEYWLSWLLPICGVPKHRYNADFLFKLLNKLELNVREKLWTVPITRALYYHSYTDTEQLIKWSMSVPLSLVPDEQALLTSKLIVWFFASSNRPFRDNATTAVIRLLTERSHLVAALIKLFHESNDPYIIERIYAVAAGVAMRESHLTQLKLLAKTVFECLFSGKTVPPHVLVRDYGRCVLEVALSKECLPEDISPKSFRPPYRSKWPKIWTEKETTKCENNEGFGQIKHSIRPEGLGMYGDFGRYVMQANVSHFQKHKLTSPSSKETYKDLYDSKIARRWILQRIVQLGWNPDDFKNFESNIPFNGRDKPSIERISKKYQWIGLHEFVGYLSDHYHMRPNWDDSPQKFDGAWQLYLRDFDPSEAQIKNTEDDNLPSDEWWNCYPDPFRDSSACYDRHPWVNSRKIDDFGCLIDLKAINGAREDYVALNGFYHWREKLPFAQRKEDRGELHMWLHIRSWLVDDSKLNQLLNELKPIHFWGNGCQLVEFYNQWIGEYPWSSSFSEVREWCNRTGEWLRNIQTPVTHTVCQYSHENSSGLIPSPQMLELLKAHWSGNDYDFVDSAHEKICFSPGYNDHSKWAPCVVNKKKLLAALNRNRQQIVWTIVGGRDCFDGNCHVTNTEAEYSAVYYFDCEQLSGAITHIKIQQLPKQ